MKKVEQRDLFRHKVLMSLESDPSQQWLVFGVKHAREQSDDYEQVLWGVRPDLSEPVRALTSSSFTASSPRLRPDGQALAFMSSRDDDKPQVYLLSLDGGEARKLSHADGPKLSSIEGWAHDGSRLLVLAQAEWNEGGEDDHPSVGRPPSVARFLPYKLDGSGITVGSRTHLHAVDAQSGALSALTEGDFDVVSGAWSPDGAQLAFIRHRSGRQRHRTDLWLADADGGNARVAVDSLASIESLAWSLDGRRLLLCGGEIEGDSSVALWLLDTPDGDAQVSGEPRRLGGEDFELSPSAKPLWHTDGRRVAVVADIRGLHRLAVVDVDANKVRMPMQDLRSLKGLARCGDRLCFVGTSMRELDELYSVDWDGGDECCHSSFNAWFEERQRPRTALRQFEVPDGNGGTEQVDAWVLLPAEGEGHGDGPYPMLVDMHGGPHSTVLVDFSAHTYWYLLLSRGWAVVAPNAVGSTSYGREFAHRLCGRWGELDLPQYETIIRSLQDEGIADDRLACTGKSYGGFLSAWAIGHCDLFRAAAVAAPVANIESHMGTSDTGYYVTPFAMDCEPIEGRDLYHRLSPITDCHNTTAATLILQGEQDGRCPRGQSEELFAHLIRCTEAPVELVVYPQSSHSEAEGGRPSNRVDYHGRIADWLERHADSKITR
ncbi:MAG: prolyl oligopeptidase family serine peptidase [Pseudomonadota bacterium]|nr:prolyl oligopeptidase family serine peptidase [Pseudomonadota bacterium]